jgi:hypothetical protein
MRGGFDLLRGRSSITAQGFYASLGFRKIPDEFHDAEPTIHLENKTRLMTRIGYSANPRSQEEDQRQFCSVWSDALPSPTLIHPPQRLRRRREGMPALTRALPA